MVLQSFAEIVREGLGTTTWHTLTCLFTPLMWWGGIPRGVAAFTP